MTPLTRKERAQKAGSERLRTGRSEENRARAAREPALGLLGPGRVTEGQHRDSRAFREPAPAPLMRQDVGIWASPLWSNPFLSLSGVNRAQRKSGAGWL